jgi:hypothetical protein
MSDVDTPRDALDILEGARAARSEPQRSEAAVLAALQAAPDDRAVRMGAYKFYFYGGRLAEAVPHAAWCIRDGARALGIAEDWRAVAAGDAAFVGFEKAPRFFLQSLVAWGYCKTRIGETEAGLAALAKAVELDAADAFGVRRLIAVIEGGGRDDDD